VIGLPHHDGSALHLDQRRPALGDTLEVRVRVPHGYDVRRVHVRSLRDAEPSWAEAHPRDHDAHDTWWVAPLRISAPVTNYRFLLDRGDHGYAWLNGTGVHEREVSDAFDFRVGIHPRAPEWVHDAVVYQIFPDRFARSADTPDDTPAWALPAAWDDPVVERGPDLPRQLYGGDLAGVEDHLDHLVALGATTLYLCPFFPSASNHRYDASTFDRVDPLLGGDEALASLVKAAHARGLRVLGDLTTNHTGATHEWFVKAVADRESVEAGFYLFTDHPDGYESWLGVPSLPKLDLRDPELRRRLIDGPDSVVARYLRPPFELDGWRIDVANMTGRSGEIDVNAEVAATIRATMDAVADDTYLVAEHFHDHSGDLCRDGWHGVMNYLGFLRPLWFWLHDRSDPRPFLGMPVDIPTFGADAAVATMREMTAQVPWSAFTGSAILLGSHDTPRLRTIVGSRERQLLAAGILATYPGVPMMFMGDEFGFEGSDGEDSRTPMPWDDLDVAEDPTFTAYRELIALRHNHEALRRGGLRWVDARPELLAYLRETEDERLLVVAVRDGAERLDLPGTITLDEPRVLHGQGELQVDDERVALHLQGPDLTVVAL
jgi:alpha-glucosidase